MKKGLVTLLTFLLMIPAVYAKQLDMSKAVISEGGEIDDETTMTYRSTDPDRNMSRESMMTTLKYNNKTYYCTAPGIKAPGPKSKCESKILSGADAAGYMSLFNTPGASEQDIAYSARLYNANNFITSFSSARDQDNGCAYMKLAAKEGVKLNDNTKSYINKYCKDVNINIKEDGDISKLIANANAAATKEKNNSRNGSSLKSFAVTQSKDGNTYVYKNAPSGTVVKLEGCSNCRIKGSSNPYSTTISGSNTLVVEMADPTNCTDGTAETYTIDFGSSFETGDSDNSGESGGDNSNGDADQCIEVEVIECTHSSGAYPLQSFVGCSKRGKNPDSKKEEEPNGGEADPNENPYLYDGELPCENDECERIKPQCPAPEDLVDYENEVKGDGLSDHLCDYSEENYEVNMITQAKFYEDNPDYIKCCVLNGDEKNILPGSDGSTYCDPVRCTEDYIFNEGGKIEPMSPFYLSEEDHYEDRDFIAAGSYFKLGVSESTKKLKDSARYVCYSVNHFEKLKSDIEQTVESNSQQDKVENTSCEKQIPQSLYYKWTCKRVGTGKKYGQSGDEDKILQTRELIVMSQYHSTPGQEFRYVDGSLVHGENWTYKDCSGLSSEEISPRYEDDEICWDCEYDSGSGHYGSTSSSPHCGSLSTSPSCGSDSSCEEYVPDPEPETPSGGNNSGNNNGGTNNKPTTEPKIYYSCKCKYKRSGMGEMSTDYECDSKDLCEASCQNNHRPGSGYSDVRITSCTQKTAAIIDPYFIDRFKDALAYNFDDNDKIEEKYNNALAGYVNICHTANKKTNNSLVTYTIGPVISTSISKQIPEDGEHSACPDCGKPNNAYFIKRYTYSQINYRGNGNVVEDGTSKGINIISKETSPTRKTVSTQYKTESQCKNTKDIPMRDEKMYSGFENGNNAINHMGSRYFKPGLQGELDKIMETYNQECLGIKEVNGTTPEVNLGLTKKMIDGIDSCDRRVTFWYYDGGQLGLWDKDNDKKQIGLELDYNRIDPNGNVISNKKDPSVATPQTNYYCKDRSICSEPSDEVKNHNGTITIEFGDGTEKKQPFVMSTYSKSTVEVINQYNIDGITICNNYELGERFYFDDPNAECGVGETKNIGWPVSYETGYGNYDYKFTVNDLDYCLREGTIDKHSYSVKCTYNVNGCDGCEFKCGSRDCSRCEDGCTSSCVGVGCIYDKGSGLMANYQPISLINIERMFAFMPEKYEGVQVLSLTRDAINNNTLKVAYQNNTDVHSKNWDTVKGRATIERIDANNETIYGEEPEYRFVLSLSDINEIKKYNQENGGFLNVNVNNDSDKHSLICKKTTVDGDKEYVTCQSRYLNEYFRSKGKLEGKFAEAPEFTPATSSGQNEPGLSGSEIGRQFNTGPAWK